MMRRHLQRLDKAGKEIDQTSVPAGLTCVASVTGLGVGLHTNPSLISRSGVPTGIPMSRSTHGILHKMPMLGMNSRLNQVPNRGTEQITSLPTPLQDAARKPVCTLVKVSVRRVTLVRCCMSIQMTS